MSWLEFIASVVAVLVWPCVFFAFMLRVWKLFGAAFVEKEEQGTGMDQHEPSSYSGKS